MKSLSRALTMLFVVATSSIGNAQDRGEAIFNQICVACHTIGNGRLVGPDLAGVHIRRDESWLINMIQSAQSLIDEGDTVAEALLAEYNGIVMPSQTLPIDDIRAVLGYIALQSGGVDAIDEPAPEVNTEDLLPGNVQFGRDLFVGRVRFQNRGASCITCHNLNTGDVMTGGSLAKDLTDSVPRLTRLGVDAMMASPPFAPMRVAFDGKEVTEEERKAIVDYLQFVEANQDGSETQSYGVTLLTYGLIGIVVLLGFFFLLGQRGSKETVNHAIYKRQVKTS